MAVSLTTNLSIWVQLASFIAFGGLVIPVAPKDEILKDLIKIEMGVQAVELGFYSTLLKGLSSTDVSKMAQSRYYDWILTTPTMLFTTMVYLEYARSAGRVLTIGQVWEENKEAMKQVLLSNVMMLIVGYLGEIGRIPKVRSLTLGFAFLLLTFGFMYQNFVQYSTEEASRVYNSMFFLWALYGVAAMLDENKKNISYNILDLFAKNFFGIFLYLKVRSLRLQ